MMWASDIVPRRLESFFASQLLRRLRTGFVEEFIGRNEQFRLWTLRLHKSMIKRRRGFALTNCFMLVGRFLFVFELNFLMRDGSESASSFW